MKGALIILAVIIVVGIILYIGEMRHRRKLSGSVVETEPVSENIESETAPEEEGEGCCGLHLVCEKDSLSPMSADIEYYDDEELDRFIGRPGNDYTSEETEEFRDVLMTLRQSDVMGGQEVSQRGISNSPLMCAMNCLFW